MRVKFGLHILDARIILEYSEAQLEFIGIFGTHVEDPEGHHPRALPHNKRGYRVGSKVPMV